MDTNLSEKNRNVIPRWRYFRTTVAIGDLKSSGELNSSLGFPEGDFLASKLRDWRAHKSIPFAADLVNAAFVLKRHDEAAEAATFLLNQRKGVPDTARSLAHQIVNPTIQVDRLSLLEELCSLERSQIQQQIHKLRLRLREAPRNSVAYVDLARAYTLLDHKEPAKRAMDMALRLEPNNRFILRSAARFYIHIEASDKAHEVLRRSEATKYDPWLLAAEIAVASSVGHTARFAKTGQRTLTDDRYEPAELTELASALATLELEHGKARDARKLFRKALISPTENSIAQIKWASRRIAGLESVHVSEFNNVPRIHEAQAWEHHSLGNWKDALHEAWNWFCDQPFSSRPISLGSYIASTILGDYEEGVRILKQGLISNPDNTMLLNNLAFSYASLGRVKEAQKAFDQINLAEVQGEEQVVVTATKGLIAFRSGRIAEGRAKYLKAIEMAKQYQQKLRAMACIYYAREEIYAGTIQAVKAREQALEESKEIKEVSVLKVIERELSSGNEKVIESSRRGVLLKD